MRSCGHKRAVAVPDAFLRSAGAGKETNFGLTLQTHSHHTRLSVSTSQHSALNHKKVHEKTRLALFVPIVETPHTRRGRSPKLHFRDFFLFVLGIVLTREKTKHKLALCQTKKIWICHFSYSRVELEEENFFFGNRVWKETS